MALVIAIAVSGCSPTYFSDLLNTSRVYADLATPGLIAWTFTKPQGATRVIGSLTITNPIVTLLLDPNSSPVTFSDAKADFFDSSASADSKGRAARTSLGLNTLFFPFVSQLQQKDRSTIPGPQSVTLNGIVSPQLIAATDITASGSQVTAVYAAVTLQGQNALGQKITTNVGVPINVTYGPIPQ